MAICSNKEKHLKTALKRGLCVSFHLPVLLHLLLGRAPIRRLAQSIITILLLISPLSFSTDKVPSFIYECPVSSVSSVKTVRAVAVQRSALKASSPPQLKPAVCTTFPTVPLTPTAALVSTAFPSRAPPA